MRFYRFLKSLYDILYVFIFLKIFKQIDIAESNTAYSDLQALFLAARDGYGRGSIVEVGAYKGKSTIALASGSACAGREKVMSIDPHGGGTLEVFRGNIAKCGLSGQVMTVVAVSREAREKFEGPIRLIFIDGLHDYKSVKDDIELWKGPVIDGGILAFHDYNYPTVHQAVKELTDSLAYTFEVEVGCTAFVSKGKQSNQELFRTIRLFNSLKRVLLLRKAPK
jgi:predicted O-methyltransferase YrrM